MGVIHFSYVQHAISLSLYQWTNTIKHMLYALSERWKKNLLTAHSILALAAHGQRAKFFQLRNHLVSNQVLVWKEIDF